MMIKKELHKDINHNFGPHLGHIKEGASADLVSIFTQELKARGLNVHLYVICGYILFDVGDVETALKVDDMFKYLYSTGLLRSSG